MPLPRYNVYWDQPFAGLIGLHTRGQMAGLPARELEPGDIVELKVGDRVPADVRVIELRTATVRAEQASLTGESVAVLKHTDPCSDPDCELQARTPFIVITARIIQ